MITPNAIDRVLDDDAVVHQHGKELVEWMKKDLNRLACIDEEKDAPLPKWAIEILRYRAIGYRTRIKILCTHHWDITGENPDIVRLQKKDMRNAPPKPIPQWLADFRKRHQKIADEYIKSKEKEIQK